MDLESDSELTREYGYKHARQIELASVSSRIQISGVQYPKPEGVKSSQIQSFLREFAPEIETNWKDLGEEFVKFQGSLTANQTLSDFLKQPNVKTKLATIQQLITAAFENAASDPKTFESLKISKDMLEWLDSIKKEGNYLMVRSSGAEDTRKTANAGGNLSVPYVKPEKAALCQALGKVVVSYFGEGSLQNRINAGENPYTSPLSFSVSVGELIGEPVGGATNPLQIPVSIVVFSNEPMFVGKEPFRVMRLSATYGHGEGVVGAAGVKSDTVLLLRSVKHPDRLYILEDNNAKPFRLAPQLDSMSGEIKLMKTPNPPELAEGPALDQETLTRLFYLGVAVEKIYGGHPMDMELIVKNGVIHPVQSRPVNRPESNPTYLDWKKVNAMAAKAVKEKNRAEPFLPGLAETQVINSPSEILIEDNLEKAEKKFKKGLQKLVIVHEEEPANSHPVVNFSGMGCPVMYTEDTQAIQNMAAKVNDNSSLIACVQSGNLVLWDKSIKSDDVISRGYTVHPARVAVSVDTSRLPPSPPTSQTPNVPKELKSLLMKSRSLESSETALIAINQLKEEQNIKRIGEQRKKIAARVRKRSDVPARAQNLLRGLEKLERATSVALSELKASVKQGKEDRLHPLFHNKVVETLVSQPEAPRALGRLSIINTEPQLRAVEQMLDYQESFDFPTVFHDEVLDVATMRTNEQEVLWKNFLTSLERANKEGQISSEEIGQFKKLLGVVREMDLLPLFMARFFLPDASKRDFALTENAPALMRGLLSLVDKKAENYLTDTQSTAQEMRALEDNLASFGDPAKFDAAWNQLIAIQKDKIPFTILRKESNSLTPDDTTAKQAMESSQIARIVSYENMASYVNLMDGAIKRMKASTSYPEETKAIMLGKMLESYLKLLEDWAPLSKDLLKFHWNWPLKTYIDKIKTQLKATDNSSSQLRPSTGFNVSAAVLGASTELDRALPGTKEDIFTLIHQNLLVVTQTLTGKEMAGKTTLPTVLIQAQGAASKLPVQLTGYSFPTDQIVLHYNYPLRNHSATFQIRYDKTKPGCVLDIQFLGQARNRWSNISKVLEFYNRRNVLKIEKNPDKDSLELKFSLRLDTPEDISKAFEELKQFADYTMAPAATEGNFFKYVFEDLEKAGQPQSAFDAAVEFTEFPDFRLISTSYLLGTIEKEQNPEKALQLKIEALKGSLDRNIYLRESEYRYEEISIEVREALKNPEQKEKMKSYLHQLLDSSSLQDHLKCARLIQATYQSLIPEVIDMVFNPLVLEAIAPKKEVFGMEMKADFAQEMEKTRDMFYWEKVVDFCFAKNMYLEEADRLTQDPKTPEYIRLSLSDKLDSIGYFYDKNAKENGREAAIEAAFKFAKVKNQQEGALKYIIKTIESETNSDKALDLTLRLISDREIQGFRVTSDYEKLYKKLEVVNHPERLKKVTSYLARSFRTDPFDQYSLLLVWRNTNELAPIILDELTKAVNDENVSEDSKQRIKSILERIR